MKLHPILPRAPVLALALCLIAPFGNAQVPAIINHQGKLLVSGVTYTGTAWFKFALVNASGDQTYWSHNGTGVGGAEPTGSGVALDVSRGVFSVNLGDTSVSNMTQAIPPSMFTNADVRLRIWVRDTAHGFELLAPDRRLAAVPYALVADRFTGVVQDSQLPKNLARVDNAQTFTAAATFAGPVVMTNTTNRLAGEFTGSGAGLTRLDAGQLTGTIDAARLPASLGFLQATQVWTGGNVFKGVVNLTNDANRVAGLHSGDGSGLTNLNAASLTGKLPASVASGLTPPGALLASVLPRDPNLLNNGYQQMMSVPAPGWVNGATSKAPNVRYAHTAVWDGQEMIVWGGSTGLGSLAASGGLYQPDADEWQAVSTLNAPSARSDHTAVWTGSEMIVWGGADTTGFLASGGRFQPGSQTWRAVSTVGSPAERKGHCAVWTGSRMAIWGGRNGDGLLNDGSLYDPAQDRWVSLPLANAPGERHGATALWAGDSMLVWGGNGPAGPLNTGAQLRFVNGVEPAQWVSISTTGAPTPRSGHSAIWTGDRMLVWGGVDANGNPLASGAAYDPVSDAWTALTEVGAPAARFGHNALWTGQEMLIVDGANATGELASGSSYDPAAARWTPLSRLGNPQARTGATAVWSGTEILVFGGVAAGQPQGALQRLTPQPTWFFYRKL